MNRRRYCGPVVGALLGVMVLFSSLTVTAALAEEAPQYIVVTFAHTPVPKHAPTGPRRKYGAPQQDYLIPRALQTAIRGVERDFDLKRRDSWPIGVINVYCIVFETAPGIAVDVLLERMTRDHRVESAQPLQEFRVLTRKTYNDPYLPLQHAALALQIQDAHRWASGDGVRVAVIDTGIDTEHPELRGRFGANENFTRLSPGPLQADRHGTLIAGIIGSSSDNGIGIVGVAPGAELLALRACWPVGTDGEARCDSFTLARALAWALENEATIVNLSLAGPPDPLLARLLQVMLEHGVVVVAAASDHGQANFPASMPGVLSVQAAGSALVADALLAAPGVDVISTTPQGAFDFASGSSLAAAHVSGVAALLLEKQPALSSAHLAAILRNSTGARDAGQAPYSVNACRALAELLGGGDCPATPPVANDL